MYSVSFSRVYSLLIFWSSVWVSKLAWFHPAHMLNWCMFLMHYASHCQLAISKPVIWTSLCVSVLAWNYRNMTDTHYVHSALSSRFTWILQQHIHNSCIPSKLAYLFFLFIFCICYILPPWSWVAKTNKGLNIMSQSHLS